MLDEYKKIIDKNLKKFLKPKYPQKLWEAMAYTVLAKGKRIRPILTLEFCRMFSGDYKIAIPTACAVEMLHSQSLIFDDLPCMDNDDLRRGQPSNHKVFGEAIALMAGDALISYAPQIILENTHCDSAKILRVLEEYFTVAGAKGIVGGQVVDMEYEGQEIDRKTLRYIHENKTAALFKFAVKAGAILGGASKNEMKRIETFAIDLGLAFQIADDILDEIATTEELGKTAGKDKNAKKATYTSLYGLKKAKHILSLLTGKSCGILYKSDMKSQILVELLTAIEEKIK